LSTISDWNSKQKRLKETIKKTDHFSEAKELYLQMHRSVHFTEVSPSQGILDDVWDGLDKEDFSIIRKGHAATIAWNIWHITRIEDITVNILVNNSKPVLDSAWLQRLNTQVTDTGNAMTDEEIVSFSQKLNIAELKDYRNAVGKQTQSILKQLTVEDMKRKFTRECLDRIVEEGGVLKHPDSIWLIDFWGKKDVAGIILMPVTRHQIVHLNECIKIKNTIKKQKNFHRP
jgi:hypothetical protein